MTNEIEFSTRLSREEFASAVQKGLGRALLHVRHYGISNVEDILLDACLRNYTYDIQCEPGRDEWLFEMIYPLPEYPDFRAAILEHVAKDSDERNLVQLCNLAWDMAEKGDQAAREVLRKQALKAAADISTDENYIGPAQWIGLEGLSAFIDLAKIYGRRLLADSHDANVPYWLNSIQQEPSTRQAINERATNDPEIKAYFDLLESHGSLGPLPDAKPDRKAFRRRMREKYTLERALNNAGNKIGEYPGEYAQFGRFATERELKQVYKRMKEERDPAVRLRLLWVFRRTAVPYLDDVLFEWAQGREPELKCAAISALSNVINPEVHDLARSKLESRQLVGPDQEALNLFLNNYESGDAQLIAQALESITPDRDDAHSLTMDLTKLAERYKDAALTPALLWGYENTPCLNCREWVIEQLNELNQINDAMRHECLYDANEDIRFFAREGCFKSE